MEIGRGSSCRQLVTDPGAPARVFDCGDVSGHPGGKMSVRPVETRHLTSIASLEADCDPYSHYAFERRFGKRRRFLNLHVLLDYLKQEDTRVLMAGNGSDGPLGFIGFRLERVTHGGRSRNMGIIDFTALGDDGRGEHAGRQLYQRALATMSELDAARAVARCRMPGSLRRQETHRASLPVLSSSTNLVMRRWLSRRRPAGYRRRQYGGCHESKKEEFVERQQA
jgi:hypothetical protein